MSRSSRMRTVTDALPAQIAQRDGLAYSLWLPDPGRPVRGGVVILHGAGSCKESHHDFARALLGAGFAALAFDQRGHGASDGPMDARVADDVASMAAVLREGIGDPGAPIALRGSSMGGLLAILAAARVDARAVVAICPASAAGLRRGIAAGRFGFAADIDALEGLLALCDLNAMVESLEAPLLILHAEGDEQVPVEHSRELATHMRAAGSRLIAVPGGHHRSIQHDGEMQAVSLRFLERSLSR
ncbi:MAG: lysophospholipase [Actinomycetota bacterium]|nr:lysophospholipase [Actinomycetota bacterium]